MDTFLKEMYKMPLENSNKLQNAHKQLRVAHDKLMQAQQKIDNREINEQLLLEQALDAVNNAMLEINDIIK